MTLQKLAAAIAAAVLLLLLACEEMPAPGVPDDPPPPARNDLNPPGWLLGGWSTCTAVPGGVEVSSDDDVWIFTADSVESVTVWYAGNDEDNELGRHEIDYTAPAYTVTDDVLLGDYVITGSVPDRHGTIVMVRHTFSSSAFSTYRATVSSTINGQRQSFGRGRLLCLLSLPAAGLESEVSRRLDRR